ncbi:MAG: type II secretion system F family protein [Candidatus Aenigmatarchaeota archaeon]|nr:MAG: type II secretion system F family protein [Candidatus Aenigmarchaeota archaeon]
MKEFKYLFEVISIVIGVVILGINNIFVAEIIPFLVPVLNVIGGIILVVPPTLIFYTKYRTKREMEQRFVGFVMDMADSINSGMTLPMALEHCSNRDYSSLTLLVNDLNAQVNWGIPFEKALKNFARATRSRPIRRSVTTIIETYKVGGKISDTLSAVSKSMLTIEKINKERRSSVYSQVIMLFLIFFVFIGILIIMQVSLIPVLSPEEIGGLALVSQTTLVPAELYTETFIFFIIIQGFFAGLAVGKMAEGTVAAGLKHSVFLIIIGYALFSFAVQFQISFL